MTSLKELFLLDPQVTFLNHGSFGATPKPVFETCQAWQREMERQPVEFLFRREIGLMAKARESLANYINCLPNDIVYYSNATSALNTVFRSLPLQPGDEILTTNAEYISVNNTLNFVTDKSQSKIIYVPISFPFSGNQFVEEFWSGVTEKTRVILLSHITSETALILPIKEIIKRARKKGILTIIDAAHALSQIPIDLSTLQPDYYASNCHKWLCAPKGSAFLYTRKQLQPDLDPLVVSWRHISENPRATTHIDDHEWQGTRDISAFLSTPAAIQFQRDHDWDSVRNNCHLLAVETHQRINDLTNLPPLSKPESFSQMFSTWLPELDTSQLKLALYDRFKIEIPILRWNSKPLIRVSIQAYNDRSDTDKLLSALKNLLPL